MAFFLVDCIDIYTLETSWNCAGTVPCLAQNSGKRQLLGAKRIGATSRLTVLTNRCVGEHKTAKVGQTTALQRREKRLGRHTLGVAQ